MAKKKITEPELTPYEKAGMYTILSEEETETHKIVTLRTYGGAITVNRIPKHTPEEERELRRNIAQACVRIEYPDIDFSKVKRYGVII